MLNWPFKFGTVTSTLASSFPIDPYWLVRYSSPDTTFSKVQAKLSFEDTTKKKKIKN